MKRSRLGRATWLPRDYLVLMVGGTCCLCLVILVAGTVAGVLLEALTPELLGTVSGAGMGGGLLDLGVILYWIVRVTVSPGTGR